MKREKGGPEKPPRSAGQRSYGGLGATGRLPLSTDKAPRGRRGTLSPAAAAAGTEAAAAHGAGSSASEEGAETERTGRRGKGREESSHPTRSLLSAKKGVRNGRAEEARPPGKLSALNGADV